MVGNNLYCTALYIFIIYKYIIYKRKAFRNILNTWETYGNCKNTVTDEMLFESKRDSVEAACISEAIRTKRREQDEDGTSLLTFPTISKPHISILKPQIFIFSKAKRSNLSARIKKTTELSRFVCLLSAEEDQGHKLWCTSTNLQESDEWIGLEGPQTYGWIVRSKPSIGSPFFFWNGIITKRT